LPFNNGNGNGNNGMGITDIIQHPPSESESESQSLLWVFFLRQPITITINNSYRIGEVPSR